MNGIFAPPHLTWDDASRQLTIARDASSGALKPIPRRLTVELLPEGCSTTIVYDGHRVEVRF